jgi:GntR family transcriptional regulator / MocR family aminotransferase
MQIALASFIDDGMLDKHIRRCKRVYAERRHLLTHALSGPLVDHLTAPQRRQVRWRICS